jgi:nitroreductase
MELYESILTRTSKRDFKDIPVPKELIDKILSASLRAPSWANSQPWEIAVSTGKTSEFIKSKIYKLASKDDPGNPDFTFPTFWPKKQSANMFETGKHRYEALNISRGDVSKRKDVTLSNYFFFGSQTAVFIYMDENLGHWSALDSGMLIQNILLCVHDSGLGACPQAYLVRYPDILREAFNLPASKKFILGISIGYYNKESAINNIVTSRNGLEDIVSYYD